MTTVVAWPDPERLTRDWQAAVGVPPLGSELRNLLPERWVRFHYLPNSERLVTRPAERTEVLARYRAVLTVLTGATDLGDDPLLVITAAWDDSPPADRPAELAALLPAVEWKSLVHDDDPATTLYASEVVPGRDDDALDELLLDWVAADRTAEVIVAPPSLSWLFHPYDGGMDVIAPDTATRDRLREQFADWLSPLPSGL